MDTKRSSKTCENMLSERESKICSMSGQALVEPGNTIRIMKFVVLEVWNHEKAAKCAKVVSEAE